MITKLSGKLSSNEINTFLNCVEQTENIPIDFLLHEAWEHLFQARKVIKFYSAGNLQLAEDIFNAISVTGEHWDKIPSETKLWFKGMIRYFTLQEEEDDDFTSPVGFEGDAIILNTCLEAAGLDKWQVNIKHLNKLIPNEPDSPPFPFQ